MVHTACKRAIKDKHSGGHADFTSGTYSTSGTFTVDKMAEWAP